MYRKFLSGAIGFFALLSAPAQAETFDNLSVIELSQAGLSDEVILSKIDTLPCSYDVSTDALISLSAEGVSNVVIAAMVDRCVGAAKAQGAAQSSSDPTVMRPPGVYIDLGNGKGPQLDQLRPTVATTGRVTGNGSLLFPFKAKVGVAGPNARTEASESQPKFYFYFETADARVSDFGVSGSIAAQSPSEFTLVRFKVKKGQREMVVGKSTTFNSSLGIDPKASVAFTIDEIGDSIFRVAPQNALEPGEYGFVLKFGGNSYRIFDFSVRE